MISGIVGLIHFIASILALITGTMVLAKTKGTKQHIQIGYVYSVSMVVVLVTSFMIYRLHGAFGILHWLAVLSSVTLVAGMVPLFLKKPKNYISTHFSFMYWSVIGLYCAFVAEVLTRIPFIYELDADATAVFYGMVGVGTGLTAAVGSFFFRKYKKKWALAFGQ